MSIPILAKGAQILRRYTRKKTSLSLSRRKIHALISGRSAANDKFSARGFEIN